MKVIDRTKAVTQNCLESSFKKLSIEKKRKKERSEKHKKIVFFTKCLLRHGVLRVLCRYVCKFLDGPFCHCALKVDISTLFTRFFI